MTTVEYGNGLENRLSADHVARKCSTCSGNGGCFGHSSCDGGGHCVWQDWDIKPLSSTDNSGVPLRPTLPKITTNTPSLLETYVSTVGKEKVTPKEVSLLTKLEALDLDPIKVKLMDAEEGYGWTREQADTAANAYKQLLFINAKYDGNSIVPTKLVDNVWHQHILDTRKYAEDSQELFGRFLHHFPYFGLRGEEDAADLKASFAETQDLFVQNFGSLQLSGFDEKKDSGSTGRCHWFCNSDCRNTCF